MPLDQLPGVPGGGYEAKIQHWRGFQTFCRSDDFVVRVGRKITAIEVKSGRAASALPGMQAFNAAFQPDRMLLVGANGIPLDEFLCTPAAQWITTPPGMSR